MRAIIAGRAVWLRSQPSYFSHFSPCDYVKSTSQGRPAQAKNVSRDYVPSTLFSCLLPRSLKNPRKFPIFWDTSAPDTSFRNLVFSMGEKTNCPQTRTRRTSESVFSDRGGRGLHGGNMFWRIVLRCEQFLKCRIYPPTKPEQFICARNSAHSIRVNHPSSSFERREAVI